MKKEVKKKRSLHIPAVLAMLFFTAILVSGCDRPKSPVGESKIAASIREGIESAPESRKIVEQPASGALSAGLTGRVSSATADVVTEEGDAIKDGDPKGVPLTLWTYSDAHVQYYRKLLGKWNDEDPDYTLEITFKVMPYNELHDSLITALQTGEGAPDICDIDAFSFAELTEGLSDRLYPLDTAYAPYIFFMHQARTDVYKGSDGKRYAVPFRMGAAVQYWNMELLEAAGITQKEVDSVKTWDDYKALGERFGASPAAAGKYFTVVDQEDPVWPMLALAEYSNEPENTASAVSNMQAQYQGWISSGMAKSSYDIPGDIATGSIASFTGSLVFMDRFVQDMHDESGKWYITKCPVFTDGQPCSVCLDDSATVICAASADPQLAADFICFAKMYKDNVRGILWPDLSYDVCYKELWENEDFAHDPTNEYNTFFRNYPYDVLKEISDRIATVKP